MRSEERIKERDVNFVIRFVREKMKDIGSDLVGMNIDFQYMRLCNHFHICSNIKYSLRDCKPNRFVMFPVPSSQIFYGDVVIMFCFDDNVHVFSDG